VRVDMLVYNRCTTDARVLKEAASLTEAGHSVRILAVLDTTTEPAEELDGIRIVRIDRRPPHLRLLRALRRVAGLWRRALVVWRRTSPRAVAGAGAERASRPSRHRLVLAAPALVLRAAADLAVRAVDAAGRTAGRAARGLLRAPHKPLMFLDWWLRAYRLMRADPPGAIHAHDLNTLPAAVAAARRLHVPLVFDAHELYPDISTLSPREAGIWRRVERELVPRADAVLTVCESIAGELERRCEIARPSVLLNCPSASRNGSDPDRGLLRARVGADPGEPLVLYQGGFAPFRGLETLIRAAHGFGDAKLVLMGWGRTELELRKLVAEEQLEGRVLFTEPVPQAEVLAFAAGAQIGVIPYEPIGLNNTYTTPNKLFDYMAAGIPIVGSRLPELIRFVEGERVGVCFEPGDAEALGTAVRAILDDPEHAAAMGERARTAAQRFTWEIEVAKLLRLYERLLGDQSSTWPRQTT